MDPTSVSRFHIEIHHSFGRFLTWRGWSLGSHPPIPMHTFRASYVGLPDASLCPVNHKALETATSSQTVGSLTRSVERQQVQTWQPFAMFHTKRGHPT